MKCFNCGSEIADSSKFCMVCGANQQQVNIQADREADIPVQSSVEDKPICNPVDAEQEQTVQNEIVNVEVLPPVLSDEMLAYSAKQKKKVTIKKLLFIIIPIVLVIAIVLFITIPAVKHKQKVDAITHSVADQLDNAHFVSHTVDVISLMGFTVNWYDGVCNLEIEFGDYNFNEETGLIEDRIDTEKYSRVHIDVDKDKVCLVDSKTDKVLITIGIEFYENITGFNFAPNNYVYQSEDKTDAVLIDALKEYAAYLTRFDDVDEIEDKFLGSSFSYAGFYTINIQKFINKMFETYEVEVVPDREDANVYDITISGDCYGASITYGYGSKYASPDSITFYYDTSENSVSYSNDDLLTYYAMTLYY